MKTFNGIYLEVETAADVRKRAEESGVGISELIDLAVRMSLPKLTPEALQQWSARKRSERGVLRGGMTKLERTCLEALNRCLEAEKKREAYERAAGGDVTPVAWRITFGEIAAEGGLLRKECFMGLKALQGRGMVDCLVWEEDGFDRWGRPRKAFWWRVEDAAADKAKWAAMRAAEKAAQQG